MGIDNKNKYSKMWVLYPAEINLCCTGSPKNCMLNPNLLAFIDSETKNIYQCGRQFT